MSIGVRSVKPRKLFQRIATLSLFLPPGSEICNKGIQLSGTSEPKHIDIAQPGQGIHYAVPDLWLARVPHLYLPW